MADPDESPDPRATDVPSLHRLMRHFSTPESLERALRFRPRRDDVFIATWPKSGTTLLQQIVHGLRTSGDMDFDDISAVVPWLETAHDCGLDLDAPQRAEPRAFKTHLDRNRLPRGGRTIWVVRDPIDAAISHWRFFSGWLVVPGAIDLETYALDFLAAREGHRDYWSHLVSWWPDLDAPDLLPLCYEDVVADRPAAVARVARFIGAGGDPGTRAVAVRQAELGFMRRFPTLWEDGLLRRHRNPAMGLPTDFGGSKVRPADERPEAAISDRLREVWAARWRETVEPVTGCADYAALRRALADRAGRNEVAEIPRRD